MSTVSGSEARRSPVAAQGPVEVPVTPPLPSPPPALQARPGVRTLRVQHETVYEYDAAVELAHHLAHLRPRPTPLQQIRQWQLEIDPVPDLELPTATEMKADFGPAASRGDGVWPVTVPPGVHQSQDVWGNWRAAFSHARVHDHLRVCSGFVVELRPAPTLQLFASPAWEEAATRLRYHPGVPHDEAVEFALPSVYAPRSSTLAQFAREAFIPRQPLLAGAMTLMQHIYRRFEYRPSATSVATRAPEALAQRRGVCQDFAHVMIAAMRSIGLAARYVSGYLLTQPPPGQPRLVGADASHAWVAVWCPLNGWVALDPTNGVPAGQDHVTLAWGRDYADVAPLRGVIRGGGRAQPRVAVTVEPLR
ncbi:MAG: transglutaminase family protein [Burkholderiales bacterium]|nr:transglutaminase family protein [Burkholderiales bacterium]MBP6250449.1 transglutaminase family protein [Leptothrix sp. (in: b-proteobacteria)]MBP7519625.1 transglutaminase family protein [Leptothrix sp. (in: b-proteobacteria)]